jgi:hypothetical protein
VQRSDGSKVKVVHEKSFAAEIRAVGKALSRRDVSLWFPSAILCKSFLSNYRKQILLLLPVFWAAYFNQYTGSMNYLAISSGPMGEHSADHVLDYTVYFFGVRARALIGFVGNFAGLLASQLISLFLDYRGISVKKRIQIG